jgi:hypothetical protein
VVHTNSVSTNENSKTVFSILLYTYKSNIETFWWNKVCIFIVRIFTVNIYFRCSETYFLYLHWRLVGLLSSKFSQYKIFKRTSFKLSRLKEQNAYNKQKIFQILSIDTGFIFILWYEIYHTSYGSIKINPVFIENPWLSSMCPIELLR